MKHFKNITTLIFDFGGVLIDLDINQCILNFNRLGLENVEQYLNNFAQSGFFMQLEKGQISAAEFRNEIRKLTPNKLTDTQIDEAWCSFLLEIPEEKLEMLIELRKKFRVVLLSNTNIIHFPKGVLSSIFTLDIGLWLYEGRDFYNKVHTKHRC